MFPIIAACLIGIVLFCVIVVVLLARARRSEDSLDSVPRVNRRKEPRLPVASEFDLFWQDIDASHKSARARGIEISARGVSVRSPKPILRNSVVQVRGRQVQFEGKAVVRHCTKRGLTYLIGLELEAEQAFRAAGMRA